MDSIVLQRFVLPNAKHFDDSSKTETVCKQFFDYHYFVKLQLDNHKKNLEAINVRNAKKKFHEMTKVNQAKSSDFKLNHHYLMQLPDKGRAKFRQIVSVFSKWTAENLDEAYFLDGNEDS